jgi:hypothetical protein
MLNILVAVSAQVTNCKRSERYVMMVKTLLLERLVV